MNAPQQYENGEGIAVLETKLDHLSATVDEIKRGLETSGSVHVTRAEWSLRNQTVDERFLDVRGDIKRIETDMVGRRAPWWTVVASVCAIAAILLAGLPYIIR